MVQSKARLLVVALYHFEEQMFHANFDSSIELILLLTVGFDLLTNQFVFEHFPTFDAFE